VSAAEVNAAAANAAAVNAAEVSEANVGNVAHLHPAVVEAATANAPVALAGVAGAATGMVVGKRGMVEVKSAGGEAGLPRRGIAGGACPLIGLTGGGTTEPGPLLWMTA
jgi:hypothetical protein